MASKDGAKPSSTMVARPRKITSLLDAIGNIDALRSKHRPFNTFEPALRLSICGAYGVTRLRTALREGEAKMRAFTFLLATCFMVGCITEETLDGEDAALNTGEVDERKAESAPHGGDAAEPGSLSTLATCELHIGVTRKSGNTISGYGSQANCGSNGRSYLTVQRSRWYGWEDLTTVPVIGSGHDVYVRYNCASSGTHTFRTIHTGRTIGGTPAFKESNRLTVTCS